MRQGPTSRARSSIRRRRGRRRPTCITASRSPIRIVPSKTPMRPRRAPGLRPKTRSQTPFSSRFPSARPSAAGSLSCGITSVSRRRFTKEGATSSLTTRACKTRASSTRLTRWTRPHASCSTPIACQPTARSLSWGPRQAPTGATSPMAWRRPARTGASGACATSPPAGTCPTSSNGSSSEKPRGLTTAVGSSMAGFPSPSQAKPSRGPIFTRQSIITGWAPCRRSINSCGKNLTTRSGAQPLSSPTTARISSSPSRKGPTTSIACYIALSNSPSRSRSTWSASLTPSTRSSTTTAPSSGSRPTRTPPAARSSRSTRRGRRPSTGST